MDPLLENLRYPVGRHTHPEAVSADEQTHAIRTISAFPDKIRHATERLTDQQLDTPYRPDGWTIRQVVHHVADSHVNAYVRFKLAITEDSPTIKPYNEKLWAELPDSKILPVEISLHILKAIHTRWVVVMENMKPEDWDKKYIHPEHNSIMTLAQAAMMYEWHCNHHLGHITGLKSRMA